MNKLLMFPMGFMFVLSIVAVITTNATFLSDPTEDYEHQTGTIIQGDTGNITVPNAGSHTFNMWLATGAMVILVIAISVGIIAGLNILGSGLSPVSQTMIFNATLYGGLWACLSVVSRDYLFTTTILTLLWISITVIYILGIGSEMTGNSSVG